MRMLSPNNIRKIILGLLFFSVVSHNLFSQGTSIGGIINGYRKVVSIGGTTSVTVTDASIFHVSDTVLLIQMKGAKLNFAENSSYGGYRESLGTPGGHEFLIVASIVSNTITFTRDILRTYDVNGVVQLISIPSFSKATVTSSLTCQPWDSTAGTGGVLAFIVGGALTLNADINVKGKGFRGGTPFIGNGICTITDLAIYNKFYYPDSYLNSGYKGEGVANRVYLGVGNEPSVFPDFAKGMGSNFTSGGGGNGRFAGGGGGAGYGSGGNGGQEIVYCGVGNQSGNGVGGRQVKFTDLDGNLLLGSGGGSSTYFAGATATPGGKGGGVVIIVCDSIFGNGRLITADGEKPSGTAVGNGGAGGGGGGGTIAIYQKPFVDYAPSTLITLSAAGATGGDATNNYFGQGGGGGGGLITTNNQSYPTAYVTTSVTGGNAGTSKSSEVTSGSKPGAVLSSFIPVLNGFLYNSIVDSLTNNKLDSICSNMLPPKLIGTNPVGGSGTYTYTWQDSSSVTGNWVNIAGYINNQYARDYQPPKLSVTTSFRRIVTDNGSLPITDRSKPVKIIVHQAISNNIVGNSDEICLNGNPPLIQQLMPDLIVPTSYRYYEWQDSSASASWGASRANTKNYDPSGPLTITTWYRRTVRSGSCVDSSAKVRMTVLPLISNNTIGSPQDICYGTAFANLVGTEQPVLTRRNNAYIFKWESKINGVGWITAAGTSSLKDYNPVEQPERSPTNEYYYRRIVFSGSNNVCADTSAEVHLRDFPRITNNTISIASQTICAGTVPDKITGTQPSNGSGVFTYTWQDSTNSSSQWQDIPGYVNGTSRDYQPPSLSVTTSFRRIVISYPCDSISKSIRIVVQPKVVNNNIYLRRIGGSADTTICNGQTHDRLAGTTVAGATYQWLYAVGSGTPIAITGATQVSYNSPPALNTSTSYMRLANVGVCSDTTKPGVSITVLDPISNFEISAPQTAVCENETPEALSGQLPAGGSGVYVYKWEQSTDGGTNWVDAAGNNTLVTYQPPALSSPVKYRRSVTSGLAGCCKVISDEIAISINPAPAGPVNAGPDVAIYSMDRTYVMNGDPPVVGGESGSWTALDPGTAIFDNSSNPKTGVRNLSTGLNLFLWTITNGLCSISDSVYVEIKRDFIPQGFSPNGDTYNNTFIIEGLNLEEDIAELTVINGAGAEVYSTSNRSGQEWVDWNGTNNKGLLLPEGTYYYLLKVTTKDNKVIKKSGFVVLKRY